MRPRLNLSGLAPAVQPVCCLQTGKGAHMLIINVSITCIFKYRLTVWRKQCLAAVSCHFALPQRAVSSSFSKHTQVIEAMASTVTGGEPTTMPVFTEKEEVRAFSRNQKLMGKTIAFVPTMGYLHKGHMSLIATARQHADIVIASVYVNPTQFSANEDFDVYPRDPDGDRRQLQAAGCAAVFEPQGSLYHQVCGDTGDTANVVGREVVHPDAHETWVTVENLQQGLCGGSRPHFFRGVATVVTKLFHIVEPDVAVFGQKDYQQWRIITRMVRDLDFPIKIIGVPIAREVDGLAMSSRNALLSPESRKNALCIGQALKWAETVVQQRQIVLAEDIAAEVQQCILSARGQVDYVQLRDADNLQPVDDASKQPTLLAIAAWFPSKRGGSVRLIDNVVIGKQLM